MDRSQGNTAAEYGLVFGLVVIASLVGLTGLGGSTSRLLGGIGNDAMGSGGSASGLMNLLSPSGTSVNGGVGGAGAAGGGLPSLANNGPTAGGGVNTTSVEGATVQMPESSKKALRYADRVEALIEQATDKKTVKYLQNLSDELYLIGALEGEIDSVDGFEVDTVSNKQALEELLQRNQDLQKMLASAPSTADPELIQKAVKLGTNSQTISQTYISALSGFIDSKGRVVSDFTVSNPQQTSGIAVTQPGAVQAVADTSNKPNVKYEKEMSLDKIKQTTETVLASEPVESVGVEATLTDAVTVGGTTTTQTP